MFRVQFMCSPRLKCVTNFLEQHEFLSIHGKINQKSNQSLKGKGEMTTTFWECLILKSSQHINWSRKCNKYRYYFKKEKNLSRNLLTHQNDHLNDSCPNCSDWTKLWGFFWRQPVTWDQFLIIVLKLSRGGTPLTVKENALEIGDPKHNLVNGAYWCLFLKQILWEIYNKLLLNLWMKSYNAVVSLVWIYFTWISLNRSIYSLDIYFL